MNAAINSAPTPYRRIQPSTVPDYIPFGLGTARSVPRLTSPATGMIPTFFSFPIFISSDRAFQWVAAVNGTRRYSIARTRVQEKFYKRVDILRR